MAGRPKTPHAIKDLRGSYKNHPERLPENMPEPTAGIGPGRNRRKTRYTSVWDELVSICAPGVLTNMDRIWLELTVDKLIAYRKGKLASSEFKDLITLMSRLGLNPSDRQKVGVVPGGKKKSKFDFL